MLDSKIFQQYCPSTFTPGLMKNNSHFWHIDRYRFSRPSNNFIIYATLKIKNFDDGDDDDDTVSRDKLGKRW